MTNPYHDNLTTLAKRLAPLIQQMVSSNTIVDPGGTGGGGTTPAGTVPVTANDFLPVFTLPHKYIEYVASTPETYSTDTQSYYYVPVFGAADSYTIFGVMWLPEGAPDAGGSWAVSPVVRGDSGAGTANFWFGWNSGQIGGSIAVNGTIGWTTIEIPSQTEEQYHIITDMAGSIPASAANSQHVQLTFEISEIGLDMQVHGFIGQMIDAE